MRLLRIMLLAIAGAALATLGAPLYGWPQPRGALLRLWSPEPPAPLTPRAAYEPPALAPSPALEPARAPTLAELHSRIEARLAAEPAQARYFDRLRTVLPNEFSTLIDRLARLPQAADGAEAVNSASVMLGAMRRLRQTHGILAAKANLRVLERIPQAQRAIMKDLREIDPRLCADFFYGGGAQGFSEFAERNPGLIADLASAQLDAVADGRNRAENAGDPQDSDVQLLENALSAQGLSRVQVELLLDNKPPEPPLEDSILCRAGLVYLDALLSLPEEARWRLLARSAALAARS